MSDAYLDHAATTPMRPEALAAIGEVLGGPDADVAFGNPSGSHRHARRARRLLDDARDRIANALGCAPGEVVFTSGGTEADNLAVTGSLRAHHAADVTRDRAAASGAPSPAARGVRDRPAAHGAPPSPGVGGLRSAGAGPVAVCSAVEHDAVLAPVRAADGVVHPVDHLGRVGSDSLAATLDRTAADGRTVAVVSVMAANNETGARNDVPALAAVVRRHAPGALVHTDAVAAAPWIDLRPITDQVDLLTVSAHKVGGPKGIGALVVRGDARPAPLLLGGGQERERRAGTQNVAGAVALAAALAATVAHRDDTNRRVETLRQRLVAGLATIDGLRIHSPGHPADRTPGTVSLTVAGVDRESLVFLLDDAGVSASWGSSCASGASEPSHVLAAMGVAPERAAGSLRLSLGWCSTEADVDAALAVLPGAVARLRSGHWADAEPVAVRSGRVET